MSATRWTAQLALCLSVSHALAAEPRPMPEKPTPAGPRWTIAEQSPGPIVYEGNVLPWLGGDACDFALYRAADGTWRLMSCIRYTHDVSDLDLAGRPRIVPRYFFEWRGARMTDRMWRRVGIGIMHEGGMRDSIQAPSPFEYRGRPHLVINNRGANLYASDDGVRWVQIADHSGDVNFFNVGRDIMILDDRAATGKWYGYFLQNPNRDNPRAYVGATWAEDLMGPWHPPKGEPAINILRGAKVNPESPYVVRRGKSHYYLWSQFDVRHSTDPLDFTGSEVHEMLRGIYAPEVLEDNGLWYATGYSRGIHAVQTVWRSGKSADCMLAALEIDGATLTPAFDPNRDAYVAAVPPGVGAIGVRAEPADDAAKVTVEGGGELAEGLNTVRVVVTAENGLDRRTYSVGVHRLAEGEKTYRLTVDGGAGGGDWPAGMIVPVEADPPGAKRAFAAWTGDTSDLLHPRATADLPAARVRMPARAVRLQATHEPLHEIVFRITDADTRKPARGAVTIFGHRLFTRDHGKTKPVLVRPGRRSYLVGARGYRDVAGEAVIDGDATIDVPLSPEPTGTLTVRLLGPDGPVADTGVRLRGAARDQGKTGADGRTAFKGLRTGVYTVYALLNPYRDPMLPVTAQVVLRGKNRELTLNLRPKEGEWQWNCRYEVTGTDGRAMEGAKLVTAGRALTTDADGAATVEKLKPGSRQVYRVEKPGFVPMQGTFEIGADRIQSVVLRPIPDGGGHRVRFRVRHAGKPVAGARVRFHSMTAVTDDAGRAVFEHVRPGRLTYKITTPRRAPRDEWGSLWVDDDLDYDVDLLDAFAVPTRHGLTITGGRLAGGIHPHAGSAVLDVPAGRMVVIEAAASAKAFRRWTGDAPLLADPSARRTHFIMPDRPVELTAEAR